MSLACARATPAASVRLSPGVRQIVLGRITIAALVAVASLLLLGGIVSGLIFADAPAEGAVNDPRIHTKTDAQPAQPPARTTNSDEIVAPELSEYTEFWVEPGFSPRSDELWGMGNEIIAEGQKSLESLSQDVEDLRVKSDE